MITGTRVLVTGGSGFVGRRVVPLLCRGGYEVGALARSSAAVDVVAGLGATPLRGDLDDPASLDDPFDWVRGGALLNIASLGFGHASPIVGAAERAGIDRAVFVSTTAVTTTLPASSKVVRLAAEAVIEASSLRWTIIRPTMIYGGSGDRNMHRLLALLRRAPMMVVPGGGTRLQQPVHVEDLAAALVAALSADAAVARTYDIAGPEPLTLRSLILEAGRAVGRRPRLVPLPLGPTIRLARLYERVVARPRVKAEQVERLAEDKAFDITAARRDLAFAPRSFADGIRQQAAATWPY